MAEEGVRLVFDMTKPFSWKDTYPTPEECARELWKGAPNVRDLDTLIEFAAFHRQAYQELFKFVQMHRDTLTDAQKLFYFEIILNGPPKTDNNGTAYRNIKLRSIADTLHRDYGLPYSRNEGSNTPSAASVLSGLKEITISERQVDRILTRKKQG